MAVLDHNKKIVIDMDSGTVLGTNLVICDAPESELEMEEISANDEAAFQWGQNHGTPMFD